eukprot:13906729-Alexandrium_andersonii.AAC.1
MLPAPSRTPGSAASASGPGAQGVSGPRSIQASCARARGLLRHPPVPQHPRVRPEAVRPGAL